MLCQPIGMAMHSASPPPEVIDGSVNAELIPDREALLMFFLTMSDGTSALPVNARAGALRQSGLADPEARSAIAAATQFRAIYSEIIGEMRKLTQGKVNQDLSASTRKELDALVARGWAAVDAAEQSLAAELGGPAHAKLKRFVAEKVKPTMIYAPGK